MRNVREPVDTAHKNADRVVRRNGEPCHRSVQGDELIESLVFGLVPGSQLRQLQHRTSRGATRAEERSQTTSGSFKLVVRPLKLDTHPELRDAYFGNYRRLVFLSQTRDPVLLRAAQTAAGCLGLEFEHAHCGYGALEHGLKAVLTEKKNGQEDSRLLA